MKINNINVLCLTFVIHKNMKFKFIILEYAEEEVITIFPRMKVHALISEKLLFLGKVKEKCNSNISACS